MPKQFQYKIHLFTNIKNTPGTCRLEKCLILAEKKKKRTLGIFKEKILAFRDLLNFKERRRIYDFASRNPNLPSCFQ